MFPFGPFLLGILVIAQPQESRPCARPSAEVLEQRLDRASSDRAAREDFLNILLNSEVWVWVTDESLARLSDQNVTSIQAVTGTLPDRTVSVMAFTRPEYGYAAVGHRIPLLGMSGETALRLQSEVGVSLNVGQPHSVIWTREEVGVIVNSIRKPMRPTSKECLRAAS
jgi:hypothetical protein